MIAARRLPKRFANSSVGRCQNPSAIRAERLSAQVIRFVQHPLFDRANASHLIREMRASQPPDDDVATVDPANGLTAYLAAMYQHPLLTKQQEQYLFVRMNYVKFLADRLRRQLHSARPSVRKLAQIGRYLTEAIRLRNEIVQSNLRLVVSIAKTFVAPGVSIDELVSEGNIPLLRAVELFDASRGFRFSTYATYAVRNHLNRWRANRHRDGSRCVSGIEFDFNGLPDQVIDGSRAEARFERHKYAVATLFESLPDRERQIVSARFGLTGFGEPESFSQIGRRLNLSKERVRQLNVRAMTKLQTAAVANQRLWLELESE